MPALSLLARCLMGSACLLAAPAPRPAPPKLVLVLSVDQFSEDLAKRYAGTWEGGLGRLFREGAWFQEAYHDHAFTETGPGHSVLLSGRTPGHTGIVENFWFDRSTCRTSYCVEDEGAPLVGQAGVGASNARFLGTALGDWLQAQVPGSRVFSLSGKDRAAILMAGRRPGAVYWLGGPGGFTTSTAFAKALPPWLEAYDARFRQRLQEENWTWTPLRSYAGESRKGSVAWEGRTVVENGAFPRLVQGVGMDLDGGFLSRFRASPFLDQVTLEAAEALVEAEGLGRGPSVDLLTLSLSSTDYVGHAFGPRSMEMQDTLQRLDQRLGAFLDRLRKRVPGLWVVLSADHGCLDVPEALQAGGFPARRLDPVPWVAALNARMKALLQMPGDPILAQSEPKQLYLDHAALAAAGLDRAQAARRVAEALRSLPEVQETATYEDLVGFQEAELGDPKTNSFRARLKHSFHPDRSGDLLVVFKPMVVMDEARIYHAADHGTPHDYDRRVPLVFWGPWKPGARLESVRTVDLAPTLGRALGLHPDGPVDGRVLDLPLRGSAPR